MRRRWWLIGLAIAGIVVLVFAPLASPYPDGLERVAGWGDDRHDPLGHVDVQLAVTVGENDRRLAAAPCRLRELPGARDRDRLPARPMAAPSRAGREEARARRERRLAAREPRSTPRARAGEPRQRRRPPPAAPRASVRKASAADRARSRPKAARRACLRPARPTRKRKTQGDRQTGGDGQIHPTGYP